MSRKGLAKTSDETYVQLWADFKTKYGPCRMEDVAQWISDNQLLPDPKIDAVVAHTRKLKQAARRQRGRDPQGRTVRTIIPAKIERTDESGNTVIDVVWDYLREMSVHHAMTAFSQREEGIEKQKKAASREVRSFLDNNPNAKGHEEQFKFDFMTEEAQPMVEEAIEESEIPKPQRRRRKNAPDSDIEKPR